MQITFSSHMAIVPAAKMLSCSCLQSLNKKKKNTVCSLYVFNTLPGYRWACVVTATPVNRPVQARRRDGRMPVGLKGQDSGSLGHQFGSPTQSVPY